MIQANISRIKHGEQVFAASSDRLLQLGDVVMVVGAPEELDKMRFLLGEETHERMDVNADVLSVDVEVTEGSLTGKSLGEMRLWEQYTVVITRIRRQGVEITPAGNVTLEMGDNLRVVGDKGAVESFVELVHGHPAPGGGDQYAAFPGRAAARHPGRLDPDQPARWFALRATQWAAPQPGERRGRFPGQPGGRAFRRARPAAPVCPAAAKNLSRELGLMLFLAGAGVSAGANFVEILRQQGLRLLVGGALITDRLSRSPRLS